MGHACKKLESFIVVCSVYISKVRGIPKYALHKLSIHMNRAFKTFNIMDKVNCHHTSV